MMDLACRHGWHRFELEMPVADKPYAVCKGCHRRVTPQEGMRLNKAIADRWRREHARGLGPRSLMTPDRRPRAS